MKLYKILNPCETKAFFNTFVCRGTSEDMARGFIRLAYTPSECVWWHDKFYNNSRKCVMFTVHDTNFSTTQLRHELCIRTGKREPRLYANLHLKDVVEFGKP
jgi:uncharacterized protein (DUF952 family)